MAVLGTDVTVGGSGDVAVLTFRMLADGYALDFARKMPKSAREAIIRIGLFGATGSLDVDHVQIGH